MRIEWIVSILRIGYFMYCELKREFFGREGVPWLKMEKGLVF
jgi:hypothetical protein